MTARAAGRLAVLSSGTDNALAAAGDVPDASDSHANVLSNRTSISPYVASTMTTATGLVAWCSSFTLSIVCVAERGMRQLGIVSDRAASTCAAVGDVTQSPGSHANVLSNRPCMCRLNDDRHKGLLETSVVSALNACCFRTCRIIMHTLHIRSIHCHFILIPFCVVNITQSQIHCSFRVILSLRHSCCVPYHNIHTCSIRIHSNHIHSLYLHCAHHSVRFTSSAAFTIIQAYCITFNHIHLPASTVPVFTGIYGHLRAFTGIYRYLTVFDGI